MPAYFFLPIGYLLGSIPFGLFVARAVKGIDIRAHGSKNIGATNVFRVVGKKWGILVFLLDALKGSTAVFLPAILNPSLKETPWLLFAGIFSILGHSFSPWLSFKGGKGVATSLGVFLTAAPVPASLTFGLWILVFALTHIISVASLFAAAAFPAICFLTAREGFLFPYLFPVSLLLMGFIFYTHRANLQRILKGEEKRLF